MIWLRLLRSFLRGIRPIRQSLNLIATDLHTLTRIQLMRLRLEHNEILPDENLLKHPRKEDLTEISWVVKEPPADPETGEPILDMDEWKIDMSTIFSE